MDRGAEMKWISQFPGEEEVVMPPLSNLEVIGAPYLTRLDGKIILIVPLRVNVNIKSKTMGELISNHIAITSFMGELGSNHIAII